MSCGAQLEVRWWDGAVVGHLVNRGTTFFVYDPSWIDRGHDLSPIRLPLSLVAFNGAKGVDGLPGLIADCLPDAWGRKVAALDFAKHKLGMPSALKLLAWRGTRGLGALQFHPALGEEGQPLDGKIAAISASALARGAAAIERGAATDVLPQLVRGGTAGGAYPKALVLAYADGTLSVAKPDGVGQPSLLKFDLSAGGGAAACEHAYARMAAAAGINAVSTALVAEDRKMQRHHLLVRRFDLPARNDANRRCHFHSLSRLLHREPGDIDYRDFFWAALRLGVPLEDYREIARRMVFNVLAANPDDHGKNHAFLYDEERKTWSLTPAYDVTFHAGILDRAMRINGEVWPQFAVMEALCREVGIGKDEFAGIVATVESAIARWPKFGRQAGVPDNMIREAKAWHQRIRASVRPVMTVVGEQAAPAPPRRSSSGRP
jgi:serine/threonine-protein kinase HipA